MERSNVVGCKSQERRVCECCCETYDGPDAKLCPTCFNEEEILRDALKHAPRRGRDLNQWRTRRKPSKVLVRYRDGTTEVRRPAGFAAEDFDYPTYLRSSTWRKLRGGVLERDGHRCTRCHSTDQLHVHHLTYARIGNEALGDLTTLCKSCHERLHEVVAA